MSSVLSSTGTPFWRYDLLDSLHRAKYITALYLPHAYFMQQEGFTCEVLYGVPTSGPLTALDKFPRLS